MDGPTFFFVDWACFIDWLTNNIEKTAQGAVTNWHCDWATSVFNNEPAYKTIGGAHCNGTHNVATKVFCNFQCDVEFVFYLDFLPFVRNMEGVVNFRKLVCREFDVDDRTNDFYNFTLIIQDGSSSLCVH